VYHIASKHHMIMFNVHSLLPNLARTLGASATSRPSTSLSHPAYGFAAPPANFDFSEQDIPNL
jgi:hypothetical protein